MNIGIDLDNTIINYNNLFRCAAQINGFVKDDWIGGKKELKNKIKKLKDGEEKWKKLQGYIYGELIDKAKLNIGLYKFILRAKTKKCNVFIISHKTIHPHHTKSILLRHKANKFLDKKNIFKLIDKSNVYYASTLDEKISIINKKKLTWYIDDLSKVLNHKNLSKRIKKIHYDGKIENAEYICSDNWYNISNIIFGNIKNNEYKKFLASEYSALDIKKINNITRNMSNSIVYNIYSDKGSYVAKMYTEKSQNYGRSRFQTELYAYKLLSDNRINNVSKVCEFNKNIQTIIFDKIEGKPCLKINKLRIIKAVEFINNLKSVKDERQTKIRYTAKEAVLCLGDLFKQIEKRIQILSDRNNNNCKDHLNEIIKLKNNYKFKYNQNNKFKEKLSYKYQTLSPSDFGYHNALIHSGETFWLDFEYLGLDDPAKLIIDFILHPGMKLNINMKILWYKLTTNIFKDDLQLKERIKIYWPLICIRWSLIIILKSNNDSVPFKEQLAKSKMVLSQLNNPID